MFNNTKLARGLVTKIKRAESETLKALQQRRVEHEPAFTDRLLGAMEHVLNRATVAGIVWTAKTLTDRGAGSQEAEFGADFMTVFQLSLKDFSVSKGFLAQAKLVEPTDSFSNSESDRLKSQCEKMLNFSPASFVFLYSQQSGIQVVPAIEIVSARSCNPHELSSKAMGKFYQEHFECFIGDHSIKSADRTGLDDLRQRFKARKLLELSGRG